MKKTNNNEEILSIIKDKTSDDFDELLKICPLNSFGYPQYIPSKNRLAKNVLLKFVDAKIMDFEHHVLDEETGNFDILESEKFDKNDPLSLTKVKFLAALFSTNRYVHGAIYFRGEFLTSKMSAKFHDKFTKLFMDKYFFAEDGKLIETYFDKMDGGFLPYFPTKTRDGKNAIFQAYNATIKDKNTNVESDKKYTFKIYESDHFDLNSEEDLEKISIIKSLLDEDRVVQGFYYKGKMIPTSLTKEYRLYLEKTFVKKNFSVEDKDFILMNFTKDEKSGYPLFYPTRKSDGTPVSISVLNADVSILGYDKKFSNFDVEANHTFDLNDEECQIKLKIIQALFFKKTLIQGALYFDGMLIPSNLSDSEIDRRRIKAENACGIYLDDNEDFVRINTKFTIEDRFQLLCLTDYYDNYYPDNLTLIPKKLNGMKNSGILVRFDRVNVVSEDGKYIFDNDFSLDFKKSDTYESHKSEALDYIIKAYLSKDIKIRGAIYYKGVNILRCGFKTSMEFKNEFIDKIVSKDVLDDAINNPIVQYKYKIDKKTGMLRYWPTVDKNGREVLCSVVSANIFFGSGKKVVKASENLNFDIYVGETFGLVGESGSGKTTISRAILSINKLHSGGIYFKGKLISTKLNKHETKTVKKNIQMIFQDPAASLNERANIDYIVSEGLYNFHLFKSNEERLEKVTNMMEAVGLLPEHLSRYPHEFSGGQRQRIGIARALVIEPQLVLADEPISALDVSIRAQVLNLLKKLQKDKNLTYLFIAHDLSIIRYISDRIAVMHQGHIVELGKADEIYSHPIHPYTRALLTAIPQPDPDTKDERKKLVYDKADLDYEKCSWVEIKPGHYILTTKELAEKWKVDDIDSKFLKDYNEYYKSTISE